MTLLRLADASWTDVRDHVASAGTLAFLPFGALEQHGPHLPLSTDTIQCTGIAERLAEHYSGLLLPPVSYGQTWDNGGFPGTVSLKASTVTAICTDIAESVWSFGVSTLVIVNGDYGNRAPVHAAARALAEDGDVLVLDYPGLVEVGDAVKETPWAAPGLCHADELETSMVLALEPRLVHPERYEAAYPELPADFGTRPIRFDTLSPSGVFGDPRPSTAAKGETIISFVVERAIEEIESHLGREHTGPSAPGSS
ncbi:MAG: creatininase family protein [Herbiconiux sp.]|uniref:creatininase family protein n=1 Tax=Herbiconiux sp. TaxID=1871186 RepID=UPI0011FEA593|nr:creatininase family protein [Herbiconiux sp.]TAJ49764.1 MAG: creatininase family protein [Herbiconiux sp.]